MTARPGKPNPRRANGWRRDQLVRRVRAAYTDCHICGQPVDKTLPPGLDGSPEVDEIVPVSLGGDPLAFDNVQLAHRLCNRLKGNGTRHADPAQLPQPRATRAW